MYVVMILYENYILYMKGWKWKGEKSSVSGWTNLWNCRYCVLIQHVLLQLWIIDGKIYLYLKCDYVLLVISCYLLLFKRHCSFYSSVIFVRLCFAFLLMINLFMHLEPPFCHFNYFLRIHWMGLYFDAMWIASHSNNGSPMDCLSLFH